MSAAAKTKADTWMPLVIGDYLKDTGRLTTEQHGAYLLLMMDYWVNGPLQDDDEDLASITRLDVKTWRRHRPKLAGFFAVAEGRWTHGRIDAERQRAAADKAKKVDRASAGGRAKAAKSRAASTAKSSASSTTQAGQKQCPASISTEVEAPHRASTLSGSKIPDDVRTAFAHGLSEQWERSYIAPSDWLPESRTIVPETAFAASIINSEARHVLKALATKNQAVVVDAKARAA